MKHKALGLLESIFQDLLRFLLLDQLLKALHYLTPDSVIACSLVLA